ncbi:MAG TPA: ABC transporter substrate-binding protein, partial [Candidatus Limnocylindrales bacterium]
MRRRLVLGLVVAGLATGCAPTVPSPSLERTAPPTPAATASPPIAASGTAGEVLQACRSASSGGAPGGGRYLPEVGTAGGTLSIGAIADLASADPLREALGPDGLLTSLVWRRPLLETMDGGFLPDLASVPPSLDNGLVTVTPDGAMAVTWCLRDTAWSDGRAITCADYQFTLHWLDDVVPDAAARFGSPVAVDCPTPQVAIVRYPAVFEPYALRSLPPLPRQALASVTAADAADGGLFSPKALIDLPVSGPFRVTSLGADGTLLFTANPGYRGGLLGTATRLSQLSVSPFATLPALEAAFQAGTVQLATGISPTAITEL